MATVLRNTGTCTLGHSFRSTSRPLHFCSIKRETNQSARSIRHPSVQRLHVFTYRRDIAARPPRHLLDGHRARTEKYFKNFPTSCGQPAPEQLRRCESNSSRRFGLAAFPHILDIGSRFWGRLHIETDSFYDLALRYFLSIRLNACMADSKREEDRRLIDIRHQDNAPAQKMPRTPRGHRQSGRSDAPLRCLFLRPYVEGRTVSSLGLGTPLANGTLIFSVGSFQFTFVPPGQCQFFCSPGKFIRSKFTVLGFTAVKEGTECS
jgi:hypothetical protein